MFQSFKDFRLFLQTSGYKLLKNSKAKEHIQQIYKTLVEIEFLYPHNSPRDFYCLHGTLGRESLNLLEMKRKTIRFHLNSLGRLLGYDYDIFAEDEFDMIGFELSVKKANQRTLPCFGNYSPRNDQCAACDFITECSKQ